MRLITVSEQTICWMLLTLISLIGFSMFALIYCLSPLLPLTRAVYNLSFTQVGILYSTPLIMVSIFGLPAGYWADRVGLRYSVALGLVLMSVGGVLRGLIFSFNGLFVTTALFGLGVAFTLPNLPKFVRGCFPPKLSGTATGVYGTAIILGITAGLGLTRTIIFPLMGSLQGAFLVWGLVIGIVTAIWFLSLLVRVEVFLPPSSISQSLHLCIRNLDVWLLGLYFFVVAFLFYSLSGWLPTLFISWDLDPALASLITSALGFMGLPSAVFLQSYSDRVGLRRPFIYVPAFFTIPVIAALFIPHVLVAWVTVGILGITLNTMFNMAYLIPVEIVEKDLVGCVAGFVFSIGYLGALVGPLSFGYLRDITGIFDFGLALLFIVSIFAFLISIPIPETGWQRQE